MINFYWNKMIMNLWEKRRIMKFVGNIFRWEAQKTALRWSTCSNIFMNERREEQPWKKIWKENVCSIEVFILMIYQLQRAKKHFNVFQLARREIYGLNKMLFLFRRENRFPPLFLAVILHTHSFFCQGPHSDRNSQNLTIKQRIKTE